MTTQRGRAGTENDVDRISRVVRAGVGFGLVMLVGVLVIVILMIWLADFKRPEIILTIVLIGGVITLMTSLAAMYTLLRTFGSDSGTDALGLPPGSVRAMIALMLVLVFAILSVFLYFNVAQGSIKSNGLTQEQVGMLPAERIVAIHAESPAPNASPGTATLYTVEIAPSDASNDLAQQLVTLVGTLVTAVAAFYFGTNSVIVGLRTRPGAEPDGSSNPAPEPTTGPAPTATPTPTADQTVTPTPEPSTAPVVATAAENIGALATEIAEIASAPTALTAKPPASAFNFDDPPQAAASPPPRPPEPEFREQS